MTSGLVPLPRWRVPRASRPIEEDAILGEWVWREVPRLPPFVLSDGSRPARMQTAVRVCGDEFGLAVRFDCADLSAWGTLTERDDPLWQEEAVEVFLAAGADDPKRYFEFEVSPLGTLFDARIDNPTSRRADLRADTAWDCPGIRWGAGKTGTDDDWWAVLAFPWDSIGVAGSPPDLLRANFYRIERPRGGAEEWSAWSPTLASPPDFHQPARFGFLSAGGRIA